MRKALVSSVFLLAVSCFSFSQTFTLIDSRFQVSDQFRSYSILFDFGKPGLHPDSFLTLDSLTFLLNQNPSLTLEIAVHTDTRSSAIMSSRLSQRRAESIRDYFVSKGIAAERFVAKGFEGTRPLISDKEIAALKSVEEKETAHQKNRRVEFRILST